MSTYLTHDGRQVTHEEVLQALLAWYESKLRQAGIQQIPERVTDLRVWLPEDEAEMQRLREENAALKAQNHLRATA